MDFDLGRMIGLDRLDLYYEAQVLGFDGECFLYGVYFEDASVQEKLDEVTAAVNGFFKPYNDRDIYMGYVSVTGDGDKVSIYLDLGGVDDPADQQAAVAGILETLNGVTGIQRVLINEDGGF